MIFKVLNPVKCLILFIQFMNNINSAIYREVVPSQVYEIKVSEGTACVTWNKDYVSGTALKKDYTLLSQKCSAPIKNSHFYIFQFCNDQRKCSDGLHSPQKETFFGQWSEPLLLGSCALPLQSRIHNSLWILSSPPKLNESSPNPREMNFFRWKLRGMVT